MPWEEHLGADGTLAVDFTGTSKQISHTFFGAQKQAWERNASIHATLCLYREHIQAVLLNNSLI